MEVIELINSNPALFGFGMIMGVLAYFIFNGITSLASISDYYIDKRKMLRDKAKEQKENDNIL